VTALAELAPPALSCAASFSGSGSRVPTCRASSARELRCEQKCSNRCDGTSTKSCAHLRCAHTTRASSSEWRGPRQPHLRVRVRWAMQAGPHWQARTACPTHAGSASATPGCARRAQTHAAACGTPATSAACPTGPCCCRCSHSGCQRGTAPAAGRRRLHAAHQRVGRRGAQLGATVECAPEAVAPSCCARRRLHAPSALCRRLALAPRSARPQRRGYKMPLAAGLPGRASRSRYSVPSGPCCSQLTASLSTPGAQPSPRASGCSCSRRPMSWCSSASTPDSTDASCR
jgi:hypothetical protein